MRHDTTQGISEHALRALLADGATPEQAATELIAAEKRAGLYDGEPAQVLADAFDRHAILAWEIAIGESHERLPGCVRDCERNRMSGRHLAIPSRRTMTCLSLGKRP